MNIENIERYPVLDKIKKQLTRLFLYRTAPPKKTQNQTRKMRKKLEGLLQQKPKKLGTQCNQVFNSIRDKNSHDVSLHGKRGKFSCNHYDCQLEFST